MLFCATVTPEEGENVRGIGVLPGCLGGPSTLPEQMEVDQLLYSLSAGRAAFSVVISHIWHFIRIL